MHLPSVRPGSTLSLFLTLVLGVALTPPTSEASADDLAIADIFSQTYSEARARFIAAAADAGAEIAHFKHPVAGAHGEDLFTDVAVFNLEGAEAILVLGSGTHGVEGFAGSGIQTGLLRMGLPDHLEPGVGLVMYHALNPYGFSHIRRFDENNVDLNRNFVDHAKPHPTNEAYDQLVGLIEPEDLSAWTSLKARLRLAWYRLTKGKAWLQQAVSQGQYHHPEGLFFGGNSASWSNETLHRIVETYLLQAERVVVIDVHTGLGRYGAAEVITSESEEAAAYRRAQEWWGERATSTVAGDSVSPPVYGALKLAFQKMLPDAQVTAVGLEFGTYPASEVFWTLRAENWLHHHGGAGYAEAGAIKADLKQKFYPQSDDWKDQVWRQGREVVLQALDALN